MAALKFTLARVVPFRVMLKAGLLAGLVVIAPVYTALVWAQTGHAVRGTLKGLILLLSVAFGGWVLYWLLRRIGFRRGGPGLSPPPSVREPRPPGGRPPALSAAARAEEEQGR
jgi:hypothetical protein